MIVLLLGSRSLSAGVSRRVLATGRTAHIMRPFVAVLTCFLAASHALAQSPQASPPSQQLTGASSAPPGQGETILAYIPPYGFVRDTPAALASLMRPLGRRSSDVTVEACRAMVEKGAKTYGAMSVEAASAGPRRRVQAGYVTPVAVRILYPGWLGEAEVRQTTVRCRTDLAGNVLDVQR